MALIRVEKGLTSYHDGQLNHFYVEQQTNYNFIKNLLPGRKFPNDLNALKQFICGLETTQDEFNRGCFYYRGFRIWLED